LFLQADLKVNPIVWGKLSEESKTLMTSLLNKVQSSTYKQRTQRDAMEKERGVGRTIYLRIPVHIGMQWQRIGVYEERQISQDTLAFFSFLL
jgi:hypothetical protein